jgi:hypothetical protein
MRDKDHFSSFDASFLPPPSGGTIVLSKASTCRADRRACMSEQIDGRPPSELPGFAGIVSGWVDG